MTRSTGLDLDPAPTPFAEAPVAARRRVSRRRRPGFAAAGVAAVSLGALTGVLLVQRAGAHPAVLAVAQAVPVGAVVSAADLRVVRLSTEGGVSTVPAAELSEVVGKTAREPLDAGELLTPSRLTAAAVPEPGQQLVAVAVKPGQLPGEGLSPGTAVLIVDTPGDQNGASPAGGNPPIQAQVHAISPPGQDGTTVVDLLVPAASGTAVAVEASTGRVALVQLPAACAGSGGTGC